MVAAYAIAVSPRQGKGIVCNTKGAARYERCAPFVLHTIIPCIAHCASDSGGKIARDEQGHTWWAGVSDAGG